MTLPTPNEKQRLRHEAKVQAAIEAIESALDKGPRMATVVASSASVYSGLSYNDCALILQREFIETGRARYTSPHFVAWEGEGNAD